MLTHECGNTRDPVYTCADPKLLYNYTTLGQITSTMTLDMDSMRLSINTYVDN